MKHQFDAKLLEYANETQAEKYKLYGELGSYTAVADKLNCDPAVVRRAILRLEARAEKQGYSPEHGMTFTAPNSYHVKGVSTLVDGDGVIKSQWIKTEKDRADTLECIQEAVEAIIEPCKGIVDKVKAPKRADKDLLTVYPIADPHVGMYAWAEESGADQSTELVVDWLNNAQGRLVASAPESETCLIANLGDYFHADSMENKTMRSGNVLDVDSRWAKVLRLGVQAYRDLIIMALSKHKKVIVKSVIGNHDDHSNVMLAMAMELAFENNPRVEVHLPINPFQYHRFGNVLLGMVHDGKAAKLPGIMAEDMRKEWGECSYCHWMKAHNHSESLFEFPGCTVEGFGTLAAKDAWTNSKGYRSRRYMQSVVYHREFGESERCRVGIERIT